MPTTHSKAGTGTDRPDSVPESPLETPHTDMSSAPRDDAEASPGARLGPLGWLRWMWRTLTSMRTALILLLLLLLSLAAIPGSLVPQDSGQPSEVAAFRADNPTLAPIYEKLGLFEVYTSPWFAAVYLLLFLSLGGCILPRCLQFTRVLRAKPPAPPHRPDRMPEPGGPAPHPPTRRWRRHTEPCADAASGCV